MIILSFAERDSRVSNWIEKLDELIVSYKLVKNENLDTPALEDGKTNLSGEAAIQDYLKQLEADVVEWRKPGCGK